MKETKKPPQEEQNPFQRHNSNLLRLVFRLFVIGYVGYLIAQILLDYYNGVTEMSLTMIAVVVALFAVAIVFVGVISYRQWRSEEDAIKRSCIPSESEPEPEEVVVHRELYEPSEQDDQWQLDFDQDENYR